MDERKAEIWGLLFFSLAGLLVLVSRGYEDIRIALVGGFFILLSLYFAIQAIPDDEETEGDALK